MLVRSVAALLALSGPAAALAEARSDALLDLLSRVPTEAIESEPGDWSQLIFADLAEAAQALDPAPAGTDPEGLARFGPYARVFGTAELGQAVGWGLEGAWEPLIGFGPLDVEAAVGFKTSEPFDSAILVRLNPEVTDRVGPALLANGYVPETRVGVSAWARGAEDYAVDRTHYNMADPFGGDLGRSSRVALDGNLLVQSAGWPLLADILGTEVPMGHPDLRAVAAALDSPDWGEARLLQAAILPHQIDLATGRGGMPPWRVGLLADLGTGTEAVALALFSYGSRLEAEAAAKHIAKSWDVPVALTTMEVFLEQMSEPMDIETVEAVPPGPSFRERTGAEAVTGVAGEGPFVAWVALRDTPQADGFRIRNPAFMALWTGVLDRNLTILGPP
jgi:hypothetical protein